MLIYTAATIERKGPIPVVCGWVSYVRRRQLSSS